MWTWKYIPPVKVINPEETFPGFYGIFDKATDELLHTFYNLHRSSNLDARFGFLCNEFNNLKALADSGGMEE